MEMPFSAAGGREWVAKWGSQVGRHPRAPVPMCSSHWVAKPGPAHGPQHQHTGTARQFDAIHFPSSRSSRRLPCSRWKAGDADLLGRLHSRRPLPGADRQPQWKSQVVTEAAIALDYLFLNRTAQAVRQPARAAGHRPGLIRPHQRSSNCSRAPARRSTTDSSRRSAGSRRRHGRPVLRLTTKAKPSSSYSGRLPQRLLDDGSTPTTWSRGRRWRQSIQYDPRPDRQSRPPSSSAGQARPTGP